MTSFDPERHHRRSIRLRGYDYTQPGAYFVTACIWDRACLLGDAADERIQLSVAGRSVHEEWFRTAVVRQNVILEPDEFVIMPNHIHGIIRIIDDPQPCKGEALPRPGGVAAIAPRGAAAGSVGAIIGQFKSVTTKAINAARNSPGAPVWQRGYYEHIVRDEADLERIRRYIAENPARWAEDSEHPDSPTHQDAVPSRRGEAVRTRRGEALPRPGKVEPTHTAEASSPREAANDATASTNQGEAAPRPYERGGPRR